MTSPPPIGLTSTPLYVRERKDWAVEQENYRHDQAIYSLGELVLFVLMWTVEDHQAGYIAKCKRCFAGATDEARSSAVYQQSTVTRCPECYGTTFEGGVRAKLVRPALITDSDDEEKKSGRGVLHPQSVSVEATNDFRYRSGDYMFRIDGSRWQLTNPTRVTLRTGFSHPTQQKDSIGYVRGVATLVDQTSVAYMIPPNSARIEQILQEPARYPFPSTFTR